MLFYRMYWGKKIGILRKRMRLNCAVFIYFALSSQKCS
jgi:hypothetical protein